MQSENFDKKIKDSLSQPPPGNDNPAWDKMEVLLDKHMPAEKKDKRRFLFILVFLLLTGGGAFLIWQDSNGDKKNISAIESQNKNSDGTVTIATPDKNVNNNTANIEEETKKTTGNTVDQTNSQDKRILPVTSLPNTLSSPDSRTTNALVTKISNGEKDNNTTAENNNSTEKINSNTQKDKKSLVVDHLTKTEVNPVSTEKNELVKAGLQKPSTETKIGEQKQKTAESQPKTTEKSTVQDQKNKKSFLNNLFFTVSAGPDFSTVGIHNAGKLQLAYGAGLGYKISDKFSIRTGFYAARKVYSADPEDYNPSYNVSAYYPNLKNIDADCKVYEIPVLIDYTISKNKKQSWFISGGLSSLIMKEETYDFYYKPNYSPTYVTYTKTINNENKHFFSILNLSGGYTRNINQNISLQAEPYMKISLDGVGVGKIKLNSGGVLISAIIKPFAPKK